MLFTYFCVSYIILKLDPFNWLHGWAKATFDILTVE